MTWASASREASVVEFEAELPKRSEFGSEVSSTTALESDSQRAFWSLWTLESESAVTEARASRLLHRLPVLWRHRAGLRRSPDFRRRLQPRPSQPSRPLQLHPLLVGPCRSLPFRCWLQSDRRFRPFRPCRRADLRRSLDFRCRLQSRRLRSHRVDLCRFLDFRWLSPPQRRPRPPLQLRRLGIGIARVSEDRKWSRTRCRKNSVRNQIVRRPRHLAPRGRRQKTHTRLPAQRRRDSARRLFS